MSAGKGSTPRSCYSREYRENYEQIFTNRRGGAATEEDADITSEMRRIIDTEPDDEERHQKLVGLTYAKAGRMIRRHNTRLLTLDPRPATHSVRTVPPHP